MIQIDGISTISENEIRDIVGNYGVTLTEYSAGEDGSLVWITLHNENRLDSHTLVNESIRRFRIFFRYGVIRRILLDDRRISFGVTLK